MDECLGGQSILAFTLGFILGLIIAPLLAYLLWRVKLVNVKLLSDPDTKADPRLPSLDTLGPITSEDITLMHARMSEDYGSASFFLHNFMQQEELDALEHGMITDYADANATIAWTSSRRQSTCSGSPLHDYVPDRVWRTLANVTWEFDTLSFANLPGVAGKPVMIMGHHLLERFEVLSHIPDWMLRDNLGAVPGDELQKRVFEFLGNLDTRYFANAYHNATHACDVMKSVNVLFETRFFQGLLDVRNWTRLIGVLAAAVHDIGHTGQTNNYHIGKMSELAVTYNDKSPLEQMHIATAFQLMIDKPDADWFGAFREQHYIEAKGKMMPIKSRFRRVIISMILSTDMSKHNEHLKKLKDWISAGTFNEDVKTSSDWQMFALELVLHAADLSNASYPLPLAWNWANCVLEEFWQQGDLEKQQHGVASMPMFDRDKVDVADSQCGFIKFVVAGFWNSLIFLMPEMTDQVQIVKANLQFWEERKAKGITEKPTPEELQHWILHDADTTLSL